jgi:hypothetical protein
MAHEIAGDALGRRSARLRNLQAIEIDRAKFPGGMVNARGCFRDGGLSLFQRR